MHTLCIANRKGGVGKSTVAVNLASAIAQRGQRVLLIDTDSQGSATANLVDSLDPAAPTVAHLIVGHSTLSEVIIPTTRENVFLAPASADITGALLSITSKTGRETILRRALREVAGQFDLVVIDTSPEQQLGTVNALVAASHVLMPFTPDPKALEGLATVVTAAHEIVEAELGDVQVLGCVQVCFDRRLAVTEDSRKQVKQAYGDLLLDTVIRTNSRFIVGPAWHRDIFAIEKQEKTRLRGSLDFDELADEVLHRFSRATRDSAAA